MERVTRPAAPQPKTRRRSREETSRGFNAAAIMLLQSLTSNPLLHSLNPTWDTFTWLHVWEYNDPTYKDLQQDCAAAASHTLCERSLRPEIS